MFPATIARILIIICLVVGLEKKISDASGLPLSLLQCRENFIERVMEFCKVYERVQVQGPKLRALRYPGLPPEKPSAVEPSPAFLIVPSPFHNGKYTINNGGQYQNPEEEEEQKLRDPHDMFAHSRFPRVQPPKINPYSTHFPNKELPDKYVVYQQSMDWWGHYPDTKQGQATRQVEKVITLMEWAQVDERGGGPKVRTPFQLPTGWQGDGQSPNEWVRWWRRKDVPGRPHKNQEEIEDAEAGRPMRLAPFGKTKRDKEGEEEAEDIEGETLPYHFRVPTEYRTNGGGVIPAQWMGRWQGHVAMRNPLRDPRYRKRDSSHVYGLDMNLMGKCCKEREQRDCFTLELVKLQPKSAVYNMFCVR